MRAKAEGLERYADQWDIPFGILGLQAASVSHDANVGNCSIQYDRGFSQIDDLGKPQAGLNHHVKNKTCIFIH